MDILAVFVETEPSGSWGAGGRRGSGVVINLYWEGSPMKILIVDDELVYREMSEMILKPHGQCVLAEDGLKAVDLFKQALTVGAPFNLALLDIQMPRMDGQEALKRMRALERKFKVPVQDETVIIMATSMDSPRDTTEAFQFGGCNDYIIKPVTQLVLTEMLREYNMIRD